MKRVLLERICCCVSAAVLFFLAYSSADAAQRYIATSPMVPMFRNIDSARRSPDGSWAQLTEDTGLRTEGVLAYGDVVEGDERPYGGWLSVTMPNGARRVVEHAMLTPMPEYETIPPSSFQVMAESVVPCLLPGSLPLSEFSDFLIPRGAVVAAEGRANDDSGSSWLLCSFPTEQREIVSGDVRYSAAGSGGRMAWVREADLRPLAGYKPDLSEVSESHIPRTLSKDERKFLLNNAFFVDPVPTVLTGLREDDMIDLYADMPPSVPKFITADLMLHAFHLYFDRAVQKTEQTAMRPLMLRLLNAMDDALSDMEDDVSESADGLAGAKNISLYLRLVRSVLMRDAAAVPQEAAQFHRSVMTGRGTGHNPFTDSEQDFAEFAVNGHYGLNEELKDYRRALGLLSMKWPLDTRTGAASVLVLTRILDRPTVREKWRAVYEPLVTLWGCPDVNTYYDVREALRPFRFGELTTASRAEAMIDALGRAAREGFGGGEKKFAVLPDSVNFDALVYRALTAPETGSEMNPRTAADPLDLAAVLESKAALRETGRFGLFKNYDTNRERMTAHFARYINSADGDNIHTDVLRALREYFVSSASSQFFAKAAAWNYRKLAAAQAAVTELQRDTMLPQSRMPIEPPAGGRAWIPGAFGQPMPRGYVEPVPEFYAALRRAALRMAETLRIMFRSEKDELWRGRFTQFAEQLQLLEDISRREISDVVTLADFRAIADFKLPLTLPEGMRSVPEADRAMLRMACTADAVPSAFGGDAMSAGVGAPRRMSVYVNDRSGGFRVAQGFIFSYYSFTRRANERRFDDAEWRGMVYDESSRVREKLEERPAEPFTRPVPNSPSQYDRLRRLLPAWNDKMYY